MTSGRLTSQLVSLTTHRFDEDRELQLTASGDFEHIGRLGVGQLDGNVAEHLALESFAEVPRRDVAAGLARRRRGVHAERHPQHRLVDGEARERAGGVRVGQRVADLDLGEPGDDEEIAGGSLVRVDAADPLERP